MPTINVPNNRLEIGATDIYSGGTDKVLYCDASGKVQILPYTFPTSDGDANQVLKTDGAGALAFTSSAVQLAIGDAIIGGGAYRVLYEDGSNQLASSSSFTYDGSTLTVDGIVTSGATAPSWQLQNETATTNNPVYCSRIDDTSGLAVVGNITPGSSTISAIIAGNEIIRVLGTYTYSTYPLLIDTDSATALQIAQADSDVVLNVDTSTPAVTIGGGVDTKLVLTDTATEAGAVYSGANRFLHTFKHPTGDTAVPDGKNLFVGVRAGNFTSGSTATNVIHGSYNCGAGYEALTSLTTGFGNTAVGYRPLVDCTTGLDNTAVGNQCLNSILTSIDNSGLGAGCLENATGEGNTAMGSVAYEYVVNGDNNVAIGTHAARAQTDTISNLTETDDSVHIGAYCYATEAATNEIAIGYKAYGEGSNTVKLGGNLIEKTFLKGDVGISTTPLTAWSTGHASLAVGDMTTIWGIKTGAAGSGSNFGSNVYWTGSNWKRIIEDEATLITLGNGVFRVRTAASGVADSNVSWTTALENDTYGNVGVRCTPSPWYASFQVLHVGGWAALRSSKDDTTANIGLSSNAYFDVVSERWERMDADYATDILQTNGTIIFRVAGTDAADSAISWTTAATIANDGDVVGGEAGSWALQHNAASSTVPTLCPDSADTNTGLGQDTADTLCFITGGTEALRVDSGQHFGIRCTLAAWGATSKIVQIGDRAFVEDRANYVTIGNNTYQASGWKYIEDGYASHLTFSDTGAIYFATAGSGSANGAASMTTRIFMDNSGNFYSNNDGGWYLLNSAAAAATPGYAFNGDTDTGVGRATADTLTLVTGGTEAVRIDSSQNVGIGVTPEAWHANFDALQLGGMTALRATHAAQQSGQLDLSNNAYYDVTNSRWEYIYGTAVSKEEASKYYQLNGTHVFQVASAGEADNAISWTTAATIANDGDVTGGETGSWALQHDAASATVPTICPDSAGVATGFGGDANTAVYGIVNSNEVFRLVAAGQIITGNINPEADGTRDLGTQTTAQWANVWSDLINGSEFTMANQWRIMETELYGYEGGIAFGYSDKWRDGVSIWESPEEIRDEFMRGEKPVFAVTDDFIEYKGRKITPAILDKLLDIIGE